MTNNLHYLTKRTKLSILYTPEEFALLPLAHSSSPNINI